MSLKVRQVTARSRSWIFERPLGVLRFQNRRAADGSARPRTIRLRASQPDDGRGHIVMEARYAKLVSIWPPHRRIFALEIMYIMRCPV
jgi:hypothetical protein